MQKEVKEALRIRFKLAVLEYAREIGSATKACREHKKEIPIFSTPIMRRR